jgi:hypothetical protein
MTKMTPQPTADQHRAQHEDILVAAISVLLNLCRNSLLAKGGKLPMPKSNFNN